MLYNEYPTVISNLEKKLSDSKDENQHLLNKVETLTKFYQDKSIELESHMNQQTKTNQETIEKLQSMIESISNDSMCQSVDLQHKILDLKEQNDELSDFNKKFLEKEIHYKELIEIKINDIKSLNESKRLASEELMKNDIKIQELEKQLSEHSRCHSQLESLKKLSASQKQNYEKQIEDLKKRLDESNSLYLNNNTLNYNNKRPATSSSFISNSTSSTSSKLFK
ncbi:hypothetical protein PPL_00594 [Heterostelium album PN500]|uniref:Uncharacterized protein n=1 Tax=Heterostelium pallidum (strain ATCC 26659 / Pp 5 / PN500) TaxID=670386 RepID=D3AWW6_HETP5|nr:hypothetical protein PPL_00594 [Heterostelium album PN500]EFA86789.1 hypothetical protein PPL_00594 [Heterostelium album PN500]|eukprot:XP_020438893.1 hypothetical protein PPL_00594 [Heterostelium album PN500]